jgi:hypothetical protein
MKQTSGGFVDYKCYKRVDEFHRNLDSGGSTGATEETNIGILFFYRLRGPRTRLSLEAFYGALARDGVEPPPAGVRPCSPSHSGSMPDHTNRGILQWKTE